MRNITGVGGLAVTLFLLGSLLVGSAPAQGVWLASPDGRIRVTLRVAERDGAYPRGRRLYYSVTYNDEPLLLAAPLGLDIQDVSGLSDDVMIFRTQRRVYDDLWHRIWGKSATVRNDCEELRVTSQCRANPSRTMDVIWRAYNDGVAFRFHLPRQHDVKKFKLTSESSWFRFADNHRIWAADYEQFTTHQEAEFAERRLAELK